MKKSFIHAILFAVIVYGSLFPWQWRNYARFRKFEFSSVEGGVIRSQSIYKSYSRNRDPVSRNLPPVPYYFNVSARSLLSLYTRPVSMKYFESETVKKGGKIFSYLWIAFWLTGFLRGLGKMGGNMHFHFSALVILYLTVATVVGGMWVADGRFRAVMMPFIAVLSAYGWSSVRGAGTIIQRFFRRHLRFLATKP
jgi:hypothetical protein